VQRLISYFRITYYYIQLTQLSTITVNSFHSSSSIPPNNATTTITSGSGSRQGRNNYNASDYIEWCKNNNPKKPW